MSKRTQEKTIGDHVYTVTQFTSTTALEHLADLAKVAGPAMLMMGDDEDANKGLTDQQQKEKSGEKMMAAVGALMQGINKTAHVKLIKDLLVTTRADNAPIEFDTYFMGKIGHLFKVLLFVLEVNYGDFLEEIGALYVTQAGVKVSDHSTIESPKTGTYGD